MLTHARRTLGATLPSLVTLGSTLLSLVALAMIVAACGLFSAGATGCTAPGPGAQLPSRAWVDASRAVHDVVAPRFQSYVMADATLDDATRQVLLRTVSDWEFMIRQGELATKPLPPAAPAATGAGQ